MKGRIHIFLDPSLYEYADIDEEIPTSDPTFHIDSLAFRQQICTECVERVTIPKPINEEMISDERDGEMESGKKNWIKHCRKSKTHLKKFINI